MVYLILRAIHVPIVHDEVMTFFHYVQKGRWLPYSAHWDANNHVIHSGLAILLFTIFGKAPLVLRMVSLLAFPVFAWFNWKLCSLLKSKNLAVLTFIALLSARFSLEFFAMARGYGLALAFMSGALWFMVQYFSDSTAKNLKNALIFLGLMIGANMSFFNTATIALGLIVLELILNKKLGSWTLKHWGNFALYGILPWILGLIFAFAMKERGLLYYGTLDGFIPVTLNSLLRLQFGSTSVILQTVAIAIFFLTSITLLWYWFKDKIRTLDLPSLVAILLLTNWLIILLMAWFLKVNYPEDRAGIYFIPLLILAIAFTFERLSQAQAKWSLAGYSLLIFPLLTAFTANTKHIDLWHEQTLPDQFEAVINKNYKEGELMMSYPLSVVAWSYKNLDHKVPGQTMHFLTYPSLVPEWQVIYTPDYEKLKSTYDLLDKDDLIGMCLLKRKKPMKRTLAWESSEELHTNGEVRDEYFKIYEKFDTTFSPTVMIEIEYSLRSFSAPFNGQFGYSVDDSTGSNVILDYMPFNWMQSEWTGEKKRSYRFLEKIPPKSKRIAVYIWNMDHQPFELKDCKMRIYTLTEE